MVAEAVTLAHVSRLRTLAEQLDPSQYEIFFARQDNFPFVWEGVNCKALQLSSRSPQEFQGVLLKGGILFDSARLSSYIKEELQIINEILPDLIIGDLRPSLSISATISGVTYINLTNAYWSPYSVINKFPMPVLEDLSRVLPKGTLGNMIVSFLQRTGKSKVVKIQREQGAGLNEMRKAFGLATFENYLEGFTFGDYTAYADLPSVVKTKGLPSSHRYIGPLQWSPQAKLPAWWPEMLNSAPFAYLCLGSSGFRQVLPLILEALESKQILTAVSTAGYRTQIKESKYVRTAAMLPGSTICHSAAYVICNGGSPAVYQAILQGKPVIGIASNMDQFLFMQHVEAAGLGICLRADTLNKSLFLKSIERISKNPDFVANSNSVKIAAETFLEANPVVSLIEEATNSYENSAVQKM